MSYVPGTIKWGDDSTIGTPGGVVTWSANYFDALTVSSGTEADFDAALLATFDRFESIASIEFVEVGSGADITVGAADLGLGIAGVASISASGASLIDVDVFFATDLTWAPMGSGGTDFFAVALHEIGHAIGLEHVADTSEIMNPTIFASNLGNGDIAATQYLYGRDPGDEPLADAEQVAPPSDDPSPSSGGGGGGGALAAILGLLALVFGFLPGGAAAVVAAGRIGDDDTDGDRVADADVMPGLSDLIPTVPVTEEHVLYVDGYAGHTGLAGCTCGACHQQQMEDEESNFLF